MKGQTIVARRPNGFEVAHRIEDGEHYVEVSIGSSFNELYWDVPAKRFVAHPQRYEDLPEILKEQDAGWLLTVLPTLAAQNAHLTTAELVALAHQV